MLLVQQALHPLACSDYKINSLYGTYSQSEYEQTVKALQETVSDKEEALTQAQETLAKEQEELAEKETLLSEEETVLKNAQYTADGTDREENLYWWIVAWETKEDAETLVETLTEEIEQLKEDIEKDSQAVTDAQTELSLAQEALEAGIIEAENELTLRTFYADNAQEIYDVATLQSAFSEEVAKQDYEDAQQKLEDFDTSIENNVIYASYSGLITDVFVTAGDVLTQNMELIAMNDYEAVTITLSIEEDDIASVALGTPVNVTVAAFPEEIFEGEVTEIGDAQIDSNTNKTLYSVTVTVNNTDDLLYQDMTAEVTFLADKMEKTDENTK